MSEVVLNELGLVCALGEGKEAVRLSLLEGRASGMRSDAHYSPTGQPLCNAFVDMELPDISHAAPTFRSRNNQLLLAALKQIRGAVDAALERYGPSRMGVVFGTSTSGIAEAESAFFEKNQNGSFPKIFHYGQMEIGSPSEFLSAELGLAGPAYTLSTACSSSAKALLSAKRLLDAGLCDAVITGGADSLCRFTNAGFAALEALSPDPCLPFSEKRRGINIGEAAVLFLVTREGKGPRLAGGGESSDAHHISAPQPEGLGAASAMRQALKKSGLAPEEIGYLNAHGTATPQNDAMESLAIFSVLGSDTPVSSTKPLSGHTLGAAGALEAAFCWLLLEGNPQGFLPPQISGKFDPSLPPLNLVRPGQKSALKAAMSNSFGFGGSNASLILTRESAK